MSLDGSGECEDGTTTYCCDARAATTCACGNDMMKNTANNVLHVRMSVPTMMPVVSPAFVRAIRDACEEDPLLLREDSPGMTKPQPPVERNAWNHDVMHCSDNLTVTNMEYTVITFVT